MRDGATYWLFSYGTLRLPAVQMANFGRLLEGREDVLSGYAASMVEITDPAVLATSGLKHHPIVTRTGDAKDETPGVAFRVTMAEIEAADAYEVADYMRVSATLKSGVEAFVYVRRN